MTTTLKVGDMAPEFSLSATLKDKIALSDYRGNKNVLLAFYPLDFTPG
ncbi:peroxiredoxin Q/BCP [Evansella vedderi]|uniref:Peroxiredoxin Q/BCP n=1 Tax=Evansella vedderi TaxID=38282 RepID=A0ABT9ZPH5_9BACI|nr:peroxiredoxin Q/BCP [Evansella vedderi]